jgi:hypothetical protein
MPWSSNSAASRLKLPRRQAHVGALRVEFTGAVFTGRVREQPEQGLDRLTGRRTFPETIASP